MERDARQLAAEDVRLQLLAGLAGATTMELPAQLCEQEIARLQQQALQRSPGRKVAAVPSATELREVAERNVRMGLITRRIFRDQRLRIMREEVTAKIVASCQPGEDPEEKQNWYFERPELLDQFEYAVMDDKVVAWLRERAELVELPMSFVELMERRERWGRLSDIRLRPFR
jgi:FKBP-type peptidyl-prolyl cis-trans isomerase (trigger factor)